MTSNYYGGQHVTMRGGSNNTGINNGVVNNTQAAPQDALREMIGAVAVLRGQVSPADRDAIDASMSTIGTGADVEPQPLRGALQSLAGIATMVGQVGVPVVEAVRKVMAAFGLQ
jgi:hypothetical protein